MTAATTRRAGAAVLVAVALATSACAHAGTDITSPFAPTHPRLLTGPTYELTTGPIAGLGRVVVDGQGLTLYMFEHDVRGRPSRCYDICAIEWPPAVVPSGVAAPVAGPGVRASLVGTVLRRDGTRQITYAGWPLYLWPPDRYPGKATGQALANAGGLWYVLTPAGAVLRTPSA